MAKERLTFEAQVARLISRGLTVTDPEECQSFLATRNYYRFSGYFRYWQRDPLRGDNTFVPSTNFDLIRNIYDVEQEFAAECAHALRRVEVLLRTQFAHQYAFLVSACGALTNGEGLTSPLDPAKDRADEFVLRDLERSKEQFISHYRVSGHVNDRGQYTAEAYTELPVWVAVEALTFGSLSRCIEASTQSGVLDAMAQQLGVAKSTLASQVRSFVYLRNMCAHNARLWNHSVLDAPAINPNIARRAKRTYGNFADRAVFRILVALNTVLEKSHLEKDWLDNKILPILNKCSVLKQGILHPRKYGEYVPD